MDNFPDNAAPVELLPCPFCGGQANHARKTLPDMDGITVDYVSCNSCGIHRRNADVWNHRAPPAPDQTALIAKLRSALNQILDDAGYIVAYTDDDGAIFIGPNEPEPTGCFCKSSADKAMEALIDSQAKTNGGV